MQTSEQLAELAKALSKAQSLIRNASKDSTNPHFKSKYADLASVWEAIREPLTSNGLSIVQTLSNIDNKIGCTTMLLHESGQFIRDTMWMTPQQNTPQAQGSCATYLRRYMLQAIAGVAPDDDDGNEASGKGNNYDKYPNQQTKSSVVQSSVATSKAKATGNAAPGTQIFDKHNSAHVRSIGNFLQAKGQMGLFDAFAKRLEGKAMTKEVFETEWREIDPEAPDKEPEEFE